MGRRRRRLPPRCQYGVTVHNELTGESGWFQCGGAGTNRSQMCSEISEHKPPDEIGKDGWPIEAGGWTLKKPNHWT